MFGWSLWPGPRRQKVAARAKELEKAKQAFIKDEEQKRQKAAASSNAGLRVGA